ncbi:MAG: PA14 domain-containing protein, partial [Planctomycetota bacterium]
MTRLTIIYISFIIVSLMFAGQSYAQVNSDNILGIWLLDEGNGDIAEDSSGNGNDGTLMGGPNWVDGIFGNALEFSGSGTYVDFGNAEALNVDVFSVSFWCNFPSTQAWNHMASRGSHQGAGNPGAVNWGVMMVSAEEIVLFEMFNDTGWSGLRADSTAGQWHHVVATYDGDTMQLYHDGVLAAETSGAGVLLDQSRAFVIGARSDAGSAGGFFSGSIDEVGYFNTVLTLEDIEIIMNNGLAGITGGQPLARRPDPKDGALLEQTWGTLSWSPGDFALSHDVYIGDNFDDVNAGAEGTFIGNQVETFLVVGFPGFPLPDGLVPGTTYYWRIDEVNDADPNSPWKGQVWSFSIPSRTAYNPVPANGAKFIDPNADLSWTSGFAAKLHTVYFGDSFDDVNNAAAGLPQADTTYTLDTLELDKTYYWRVDEFDPPTTHKGDVWSFTTAGESGGVKAEYFSGMDLSNLVLTRVDPQIDFNWGDPGGPDPSVGDDQFSARWTGEVEVAFTETYTFYTNSDDGIRLWIDGQPLVENWTNHAPTENKGAIDLVAGNTYSLVMEYYEDGGGAVAELRWSSPRTPKDLIPQAALSLPVKASSPNPSNRAVGVSQTSILSWGPGEEATSHEVYFGTDADAVKNADTGSPEYKGSRNLGAESYDPGKLEWGATYYWRVDEIEADGTIQKGNVWSFTVADFIVIDDFESYNDIDEGDPESNRIYNAWIDGYNDPTNGSQAGHLDPPFYEETIVHGGGKSMPLYYDNTVGKSEATLTLTDTRNWTQEGVG